MTDILCIGGPLDGQHTSLDQPSFWTARVVDDNASPGDPPLKLPAMERFFYRQERLAGCAWPTRFYVLATMTDKEIAAALTRHIV